MGTSQPYVLVADDDAPTRCFLGDALRQFGARVALASGGQEALGLARAETFDLLVLDCRMPDAGAVEVLTALRSDSHARSLSSPAIASSAELNTDEQQALLATGFHAVLLKPCTLKDLQNVLALAATDRDTLPVLDDGLAVHTSGTPAVVQALRTLFKQELVNLCQELEALSTDPKALEARLHKLRSSCGFCGAASLSEHIASLQRHVKLAHRGVMLPLAEFRRSVVQTIQALDVS
ncbi:response regulator [Dyella monticola]|uniref:Response regulator n=1 Tax=Dyella monticola TaxID=1927958 RepID=A0A370WWS5_9GAMM|nr:response regulator [Dyella monticola]RDS80425.1 response regulator [Dyella monticola]